MVKKKSHRRTARISQRDIVIWAVAVVLVAAGLLVLQRRAANQQRANSILQDRQILNDQAEEARDNPCSQTGVSHTVILMRSSAAPSALTVNKCDSITIENRDDALTYNMNFGEHDDHLDYPGYTRQDLAPGQSQSFVATMLGSYLYHDHYRDEAHLQLTIVE